jgi:adenylate kinase family enzyme
MLIQSSKGCPASGKGTICARLAAEYPIAHISVGDLLRGIRAESSHPQAAAISSALIKQDLIGPEILNPILKDELEKLKMESGGVHFRALLLDGFPRNTAQMKAFEAEVRDTIKPNVIRVLSCA